MADADRPATWPDARVTTRLLSVFASHGGASGRRRGPWRWRLRRRSLRLRLT